MAISFCRVPPPMLKQVFYNDCKFWQSVRVFHDNCKCLAMIVSVLQRSSKQRRGHRVPPPMLSPLETTAASRLLQILFLRSLSCSGARWNPATCGANQGENSGFLTVDLFLQGAAADAVSPGNNSRLAPSRSASPAHFPSARQGVALKNFYVAPSSLGLIC